MPIAWSWALAFSRRRPAIRTGPARLGGTQFIAAVWGAAILAAIAGLAGRGLRTRREQLREPLLGPLAVGYLQPLALLQLGEVLLRRAAAGEVGLHLALHAGNDALEIHHLGEIRGSDADGLAQGGLEIGGGGPFGRAGARPCKTFLALAPSPRLGVPRQPPLGGVREHALARLGWIAAILAAIRAADGLLDPLPVAGRPPSR